MSENKPHTPPPSGATPTGAATAEMAALASEICDMWQEHLASIAADPAAKADFMRLIEPQRHAFTEMFADYSTMMQHAPHAQRSPTAAPRETAGTAHPTQTGTAWTPGGTPTAAAASDDSALRLAQLAHRVAALEERISKLESRAESQARRVSRKNSAKSPVAEPDDTI